MTLAAYIDRRALLLSVEDKVGVYIFTGTTLVIAFGLMAITIVVGVTTNHLLWSILAAGVMLIIAILLVVYQVSKSKLQDWLQRRMNEASREATTKYFRDKIADKVRNETIEKFEKKFPSSPSRRTYDLCNAIHRRRDQPNGRPIRQ
jgi:hypothetical protein